ncbi:MAG: electron transport complex subunit RsxB [Pseudomonadota bacterium]
MTSTAKLSLFSRILAALPQTQCTRCGYPDCVAYAQAISSGEAAINQCPPGGQEGIRRLAALTGQPVLELNPANGKEGPRPVAIIDEEWCIGCTLCIKACPTDAILGSNKVMHTVIEPYCTGCELCIPVCPVDCISLENVSGELTGWQAWSAEQAAMARQRYESHGNRYPQDPRNSSEGPAEPERPAATVSAAPAATETPLPALAQTAQADAISAAERKRGMIDAALARARAKVKNPP